MKNRFRRHSVFISSTGRTGTQFLADVISKMLADCRSLHEPGTPWISKPEKWLAQIKQFGLYHMTIGQLRASNSMFKLSAERIRNNLSRDKIKKYIIGMRQDLLADTGSKIYVESSGHIYGLLDILDEVFAESKFVFIIRDPRDWVRSALNTYEYILYGPLDLDFAELSIKASDLIDDQYHADWSKMSRFEKYCWYYNKLNSFVFAKMKGRDNFRVYRYEDLFAESKRDDVFEDMLKFISSFDDGFSRQVEYKAELMEKKVHSNADKKKISHWTEWGEQKRSIVKKHCSRWMERFDYSW